MGGVCSSTPAEKEPALAKETTRSDDALRSGKFKQSRTDLYKAPSPKERTDALLLRFMLLCAAVSVMALGVIITGAAIHRSWRELRRGYACERVIWSNVDAARSCNAALDLPPRTGDETFQALEGHVGFVSAVFSGASVLFLLGLGGAYSARQRSVPGVAAVTACLGLLLLGQLFLATAMVESGTAYWTEHEDKSACAAQLDAHVAEASASCAARLESSMAAAASECGKGTAKLFVPLNGTMVCTEQPHGCSCRCKPMLLALCRSAYAITALGTVFAFSTLASFFAVSFGSMLLCSSTNREEMQAGAAAASARPKP